MRNHFSTRSLIIAIGIEKHSNIFTDMLLQLLITYEAMSSAERRAVFQTPFSRGSYDFPANSTFLGRKLTQATDMRFTRQLAALILMATCTFGFNSSAWAEEEKDFSPEDMALIKSFMLTPDFLQKWKAMNQDTSVLGCNLYALDLTAETIEDRAKEYDARPAVHASLVSHNLTAREVVLGTTTLAVTSLEVLREKFKWLGSSEDAPMPVNEVNVKFVRDHYEEVKQLDKLVQKNRTAKRPKGAACPEE